MKKLFLPFIVVILIGMISCRTAIPSEKENDKTSPSSAHDFSRVDIKGESSKHGIYDPSVEYDDKGIGWMSYSSVEIPKAVQINLARSTNGGQTWQKVMVISPAVEEEITCNGRKQEGVWRSEVSALVHDAGDTGKEWKIFWHKYFAVAPFKPKNREFECGWIAYRHAPSPEGPWSEEIPLFGAKRGYPPPPFKPRFMLDKIHPDLRDYLVYSEPAVLYKDGSLYMSLEGSASPMGMGKWESRKVFLLVSSDHGNTWQYVGGLLDYDDARKFGYVTLTQESMFTYRGKTYLMTTPAGSLTKSYKDPDGLYIFEFEDISKARLKRTKSGDLVVSKYIPPRNDQDVHGGSGDFDEKNVKGGIIMGEIEKPSLLSLLEGVRPFRIMSTREEP